MKKILPIFLLSAMLVLALGACEGEAGPRGKQGIQGETGEQGIQGPRGFAAVDEIERLERRVRSLTDEVIWLHACAKLSHEGGGCGGSNVWKSPYHSKENWDAWVEADFPYPFEP